MSAKIISISSWEQETGKTLISKVLMNYFAQNKTKVVFVDFKENNDYLWYFNKFKSIASFEYEGHKIARIDSEICIHCGICKENCKYQAIFMRNMKFVVNSEICEGCGECQTACPLEAITFKDFGKGRVTVYESEEGLILKTNSFAGEIDIHLMKFAILTAKDLVGDDDGIVIVNTLIEDQKKLLYLLGISDLFMVILYNPDTSDLIYASKIIDKKDASHVIFIVNRASENFDKNTLIDFLPNEYTFIINNFISGSKLELVDMITEKIKESGLTRKIIEIINSNTSHQVEV